MGWHYFLRFVIVGVLAFLSASANTSPLAGTSRVSAADPDVEGVRIQSRDHITLTFTRQYDKAAAADPRAYQIVSVKDPNFTRPRHPLQVGLEWRGIGFDRTTPWPHQGIFRYLIHLRLPDRLTQGNAYEIRFGVPTANGGRINGVVPFTYDESQVNPNIKVNQVGYLPHAKFKFGYVGGYLGDLGPLPLDVKQFEILESKTGKRVFVGTPRVRARGDEISGEDVWELDFSPFDTPGEYVIRVPGVGTSPHFRIASDIYDEVFSQTARAFYHQRCGTALSESFTAYPHGACHVEDARIHESLRDSPLYSGETIGGVKDTTGGWHDAGDYGKYVPTATVALQTILSTYEMFPDKFGDGQLNIPESGNGIPDILDEVMWELDWLAKMQDPATGNVYHKVVTQKWADNVLPEYDREVRWIVGKTTHDTAKYAAVMAMAARAVSKFTPEKGAHYLKLAMRAWEALERTESDRMEEAVAYESRGKVWINTEFPVVEVQWIKQKGEEAVITQIMRIHTHPRGKIRNGGHGPLRVKGKPASAAVHVEGLQEGQVYKIAYRAAIPSPDPGFKNPRGGFGGEYGDRFGDVDERAWAAAELYKTTGNIKYRGYYDKFGVLDFAWVNWEHVQRLAAWAYATTTQFPTDGRRSKAAKEEFLKEARKLAKNAEVFAYRQSVRPGGQSTRAHPPLGWGMAGAGNDYAFVLVRAYHLTGKQLFLDWALTNWDAQLGNNALSRSYITGLGYNRVKRPLHKPSLAMNPGEPVPGLHINGPAATIAYANSINMNSYPENKFYPDTRKFVDEPLPNISEPDIDRMAIVAMSLAPFLTGGSSTR